MSETLLVAIISIVFGLIVFAGSANYQKKTGAKIYPWLWGIGSVALVWIIKLVTD